MKKYITNSQKKDKPNIENKGEEIINLLKKENKQPVQEKDEHEYIKKVYNDFLS